jgi:tRNA(Ile)-lysidine synthase
MAAAALRQAYAASDRRPGEERGWAGEGDPAPGPALDLAASAGSVAALDISDLSVLMGAVRTRVLHAWAKELGASGAALSHRHVAALDALVTDWHGQGEVHLPGGIRVARVRGQLVRVPD